MRKVLFFILYILISLFHVQAFATNVHDNSILTRYYFSDCYERDVDSLSNVTQRLYFRGSAISAPILSGGNSLYFGDPFMSASEYAYGVLGGALVGGTINGVTASVNGKNFFTGKGKNSVEDIIAAYKDSFSRNEQHNTTNYSAHDSHNGINSSSTKVDEIADVLKKNLVTRREYQEFNSTIIDGDYKLHIRVETHSGLSRVFPELNITDDVMVRHMNIELFKLNSHGQYKLIYIPGTKTKNYHLFLNFIE